LNAPTTRPARSGGISGGTPVGAAGGGSGAPLRNFFRGPPPPLTDKDLADAEQFIKDNLPNRYRLLSGLPRDLPVRRKAIELAAAKYRFMIRIRETDPDLFDAYLQQEKLRDRAVGLVEEYRKGDAAADEELRRTVADLVDAGLRERQTRIDRLEKQLADLKQQLAHDQGRRDALAEEEVRKIRNQTNALLDRLEGLRRFRNRGGAALSSGTTSEEGARRGSEPGSAATSRPATTQP
jgi:hypothetical protein